MERLTGWDGDRVYLFNLPVFEMDVDALDIITKAVYRLAAYEDAEEQGLLARLPCKAGDVLYVTDEGTALPAARLVEKVTWCDGKVSLECVNQRTGIPYYCTAEDFGKTVFLTREKSEAALKGE